MNSNLLTYFTLIPLIGLVLASLFNNKQEKIIYGIAIMTITAHLIGALIFTISWVKNGASPVFHEAFELYQANETHFSIDFFFDKITVVYGAVTSAISFMVLLFSRYYMHRESGFKRFFTTILFFYLGINLIIFSGNFETLFVGWEVIGIASFLLIAFYRDRYLPVKNALKVISYYRLADIFLLLGVWICHHFFKKSITFFELYDLEAHHVHIINQPQFQLIIPIIFLIVALVKSAQLPFSSWLPRAMEGPTSSSAIFYGSLSVHIGVFLMLRTYPLWEDNLTFKIIVVGLGLFTTIVTTSIARVQSTVKTQIAYSSIAQIGLMFVEVALGWHWLALIHFATNAFLRTYQLLVSPSVLSYLIHDQFFNFIPPQHKYPKNLFGKLKMTLFVMSIKEWNLDWAMFQYVWKPLKSIGKSLSFMNKQVILYLFVPIYLLGLYLIYHEPIIPTSVFSYLPNLFAFLGLLMIFKAFVEKKDAQNAWFYIILSQLFTSLAIGFNEQFGFEQIHLYLSGIFVSGLLGYSMIYLLKRKGKSTSLDGFHGYAYKLPKMSFIFLVACLGLSGFPITPTFIGEDLILGHIHENQFVLLSLTTLSLILDGLAIFRIFARLFYGPHLEENHEVAFRSS
jgi:NADH-quinone oxidoreductase subunit L